MISFNNFITDLYQQYFCWRRRKMIMALNKVSTTIFISREINDIEEEFEVLVKAEYQDPQKSFFDHAQGVGDPGCGAEVTVYEVTRHDTGVTVELTAEEREAAVDQILDEISDSEDDYPDDMEDDEDDDSDYDDSDYYSSYDD